MNVMALKIGPTLRGLIEKNRVTLKEISKESGVPASTVAEWTNNRTPKNPEHVRRVASYFGVSLHYLLFGTEDTKEPITKFFTEDVFRGTFEITIKKVKVRE